MQTVVRRIAPIVVIVFIGVVPIYKDVKSTAYMVSTSSQSRSLKGRLSIWKETIMIAKDNIITGVGSGNFALVYNGRHGCNFDTLFTSRIGNTPMKILVEKGLMGVVGYSMLGFTWIVHLVVLSRIKSGPAKLLLIVSIIGILGIFIKELTFSSLLNDRIAASLFIAVFAINSNFVSNNRVCSLKGDQLLLIYMLTFAILITSGILAVLYERKLQNKLAFVQYIDEKGYNRNTANLNRDVDFFLSDAQHDSETGLIIERINNMLDISDYFNQRENNNNIDWVDNSIFCYSKAVAANPYDEMYRHNLGWLYLIKGDFSKSRVNFNKSIEIDCNNSELHIGSGLLYEIQRDTVRALESYRSAVLVDVDIINSQFFEDMLTRIPINRTQFVTDCIEIIASRMDVADNPINLSKLGALYYINGEYDRSKKILTKVVRELPNMNRPWLYLGLIAAKSDMYVAIDMYNKSYMMDPRDVKLNYEIASYHETVGNNHLAITYYKRVLIDYLSKSSSHYVKSLDMYNVHPLRDELIPNGLLYYIKPSINTDLIVKRIANLCLVVGNQREYKVFSDISKRLEPIQFNDINKMNLY